MISRLLLATSVASTAFAEPSLQTETTQLTEGPKHHFFGYIGHVGNMPWSGDDRHLLALRVGFQDRMPGPDDAAEIVLLDEEKMEEPVVLDETRGWNFQQGTMFYWNPKAPETQFFFNDRDADSGEVFTVLYDVEKRKRLKEYRYPDVSFGNGGVAQKGGWFLGINYARLARFRPVTGYPATKDWTLGQEKNPDNDGIFRVEVDSGEKSLLVSYKQLAEAIREDRPDVDETELFINHTLCNPDNTRIFFFARGKFGKPERINVPFTMNPDGSDLRPLGDFIGGHPEWFSPRVMIGSKGGKQVLFDIDQQKVTGELGGLTGDGGKIFPNPEGDVAMSPNDKMFVNGHKNNRTNIYTILRFEDGAWGRTEAFQQGKNADDLRVDPGPCWNRAGNRIMVVAQDEKGTRQMFIVKIK